MLLGLLDASFLRCLIISIILQIQRKSGMLMKVWHLFLALRRTEKAQETTNKAQDMRKDNSRPSRPPAGRGP